LCENKRQDQVAETNHILFCILFLFTLIPFLRDEVVHFFNETHTYRMC